MKKNKLLVIDYGVGNIQSVVNALRFLGYEPNVSAEVRDIRSANIYIFPGVGAFGEAMKNLRALKIIDVLTEEVVQRKKPVLGICLGMQLLAQNSEEYGYHKGLGWIEGEVKKMSGNLDARIPHVGWNNISVSEKEPLFSRTEESPSFYFDHSFQFVCPPKYVAAWCMHGNYTIAAVQKQNIFGVQFHPEKSQIQGLKLLRGFLNYAHEYSPNKK